MTDQMGMRVEKASAPVDDLRDALRQFERRITIRVYLAVCAGAVLLKVLDFLID